MQQHAAWLLFFSFFKRIIWIIKLTNCVFVSIDVNKRLATKNHCYLCSSYWMHCEQEWNEVYILDSTLWAQQIWICKICYEFHMRAVCISREIQSSHRIYHSVCRLVKLQATDIFNKPICAFSHFPKNRNERAYAKVGVYAFPMELFPKKYLVAWIFSTLPATWQFSGCTVNFTYVVCPLSLFEQRNVEERVIFLRIMKITLWLK